MYVVKTSGFLLVFPNLFIVCLCFEGFCEVHALAIEMYMFSETDSWSFQFLRPVSHSSYVRERRNTKVPDAT